MKIRMKVEGADKIARKLQMMSQEMQRTHMREVALAGARVIRDEAEAQAPRLSGTLAGDIQVDVERQTKARISVRIGPGKQGWYGRLVEEGHKLVRISRDKSSGRVRRMKVTVGYVAPRPFLRPAFDAKQEEAQAVIRAELKRRLRL